MHNVKNRSGGAMVEHITRPQELEIKIMPEIKGQEHYLNFMVTGLVIYPINHAPPDLFFFIKMT